MPRKARIDIPGLLQHVIVRGIERRKIFRNDSDYGMFVSRFSSLLEETGTECFAWALLPNHFHLLIRCTETELSRFMRRLLTGYAVNFNHLHRRSGHLFQNRYKSIICEADAYLHELIRYIHLNPLRAKVVPDLEGLDVYPWSGHAVLLGNEILSGQVTEEVLALFGKHLSAARRKYQQFVADGVPQGRRPELVGGGLRRSQKASGGQERLEIFDDRVLGSSDFVESLRQDATIRSLLPPKLSMPHLQELVCSLFAVEPQEILRRARMDKVAEAKAVFCYAAIRLLGLTGSEVAKHLGMGSSAVSRAVTRGEEVLRHRPTVKKKLGKALNH